MAFFDRDQTILQTLMQNLLSHFHWDGLLVSEFPVLPRFVNYLLHDCMEFFSYIGSKHFPQVNPVFLVVARVPVSRLPFFLVPDILGDNRSAACRNLGSATRGGSTWLTAALRISTQRDSCCLTSIVGWRGLRHGAWSINILHEGEGFAASWHSRRGVVGR